MEALLFLGCTVPVRNLNYEASARLVADRLGLKLHDMEQAGCCGFPLKGVDQASALVIAAQTLSQAAGRGLPLVALCSACAGTLAEAAHRLEHDAEARRAVNRRLRPLGLKYQGGVAVRHYVRLLLEEVGEEAIKSQVKRPLDGLRLAPHYGCHFIKPSEVVGGLDDPYHPASMARLIELCGAQAVDYRTMGSCCGGGLLGSDEELANALAGDKLAELAELAVDALVVICPFCNVMFEGQQRQIAKKLELAGKVPVVYLTQLLGLAMGLSPDELGFKLNRVKPKTILRAFK